jgi:hypothetical protein
VKGEYRLAGFFTVLLVFILLPGIPGSVTGQEAGTADDVTDSQDAEGTDPEAAAAGGADREAAEDPDTAEDSPDEMDDMFADPFAVSEEEEAAGGDADSDDYESLFEDEEMVEEIDTETQDEAPQDDLLVEEGIDWGGRFTGGADAEWSWNNVGSEEYKFTDPTGETLTPRIATDLFFDARPETDFRIFGKFKLDVSNTADEGLTGLEGFGVGAVDDSSLPEGWTMEENDEGDTEIRNEDGVLLFTISAEEEDDEEEAEEEEEEPETGDPVTVGLNVFELFSDFSWKERLFFRFGKHTIKWGTGYFWSPADVLNLTTIDVEDPTADREGPVSLKTHFPFGLHNAYLYVITNFGTKPFEAAVAPKMEFVIGNAEIGLGGYYQQALAPRIISTLAWSISDFDFFGEGVMSIGSDRVFVRPSRDQSAAEEDEEDELETVLDTYEVENMPFFHATAGVRYLRTFTEDRGSIAVIGQYWFNGEGYKNSGLLEPAYYLALNPNTNGLLIQNEEDQPEGYEDPPTLNLSDLTNFGRHYAGLTVNWEVFDTGLNITMLAVANLSDFSGILLPAVSYKFFDYLTLSVNGRFTFGQAGDEYANPEALFPGSELTGTTMSFTVSLSLGSGAF